MSGAAPAAAYRRLLLQCAGFDEGYRCFREVTKYRIEEVKRLSPSLFHPHRFQLIFNLYFSFCQPVLARLFPLVFWWVLLRVIVQFVLSCLYVSSGSLPCRGPFDFSTYVHTHIYASTLSPTRTYLADNHTNRHTHTHTPTNKRIRMGCKSSSLKSKKDSKGDEKNKKKVADTVKNGGSAAAVNNANADKNAEKKSGSLEIPVPETGTIEQGSVRQQQALIEGEEGNGATSHPHSVPNTAESAQGVTDSSLPRARSGTARHDAAENEPNPFCPIELQTIMDEMSDTASTSTSSSTPQLFRISPTTRDEVESGSWAWWRQELRREHVTKDGYSRVQLQDVANRLTCQHDDNPESVDLDFGNCYMERTAPYVLGRLLASTQLKELRWITSLRLDGNYFTDDGFGSMLAIMSAQNETQTILPLLRQLYLNNMNLDRSSVTGLLAYLFPVDRKATRSMPADAAFRIAGSRVARPSEAFIPGNKHGPRVPLFPSLSVLSLSDNPGLGTGGLIQILRNLIAVHYEPNILSVIDLSRCGFDKAAARFFKEYFDQLPRAVEVGCYPVVPRRFVLSGNLHGISDLHEIYSPENTGVQLVL
jgi:hypothetical protein